MDHQSATSVWIAQDACQDALSMAKDITIGVAIPKAQGHDTTRTVAKTVIANEIVSCATRNR